MNTVEKSTNTLDTQMKLTAAIVYLFQLEGELEKVKPSDIKRIEFLKGSLLKQQALVSHYKFLIENPEAINPFI